MPSTLQRKQLEIRQKLALRTLLQGCTPPVQALLSAAPAEFGHGLWEFVGGWPEPMASAYDGAHEISGPTDSAAVWRAVGRHGVRYFDCDDWRQLVEQATSLKLSSGAGRLFLGTMLPPLQMDCASWTIHAPGLLSATDVLENRQLALVAVDDRQGIFISEHVGHLPPGRQSNRNEVIYTLYVWGAEPPVR